MAGVDLRTVQELGGWKTPSMVARYAHLAPDHLRAAVERLVPVAAGGELSRNYPDAQQALSTTPDAAISDAR